MLFFKTMVFKTLNVFEITLNIYEVYMGIIINKYVGSLLSSANLTSSFFVK